MMRKNDVEHAPDPKKSRLLVEATLALSASADHDESLVGFARTLTLELADYCSVELVGPGGVLERFAITHSDPAKAERLRRLPRQYSPAPGAAHGAARALASGLPEHLLDLREHATELGLEPDAAQVLRELSLGAAVVVPTISRGKVLGALTVARSEGAPFFSPAELALVEELAGRVALLAENLHLKREFLAATSTREEFLRTVSHELRAPLHAILGWSHLLRDAKDERTLARAIDTIERNARSEARIVEEILDASRMMSGAFQLRLEPLDLRVIVEECVESVRSAAMGRGLSLELGAGGPCPVSGDGRRMRQIVAQLLSNALRFTPAGGRVSVGLSTSQDLVELTVRDTGEGIAAEFLPHLFEPFRQADGGTTRRHGGLGIGLALVRYLVELHGGTVHGDSPGGGLGSTFTVVLPRALAAGDDAPVSGLRPGVLRGLRVLALDPDPRLLAEIATVLGLCGAEVKTTRTPEDARAWLAAWSPEVVLTSEPAPQLAGAEPRVLALDRPFDPGELVSSIVTFLSRAA